MPPKFKFTREQIVAAALEVTRKNGEYSVASEPLNPLQRAIHSE